MSGERVGVLIAQIVVGACALLIVAGIIRALWWVVTGS